MSNCIIFAVSLYWRRWLASRRVRIEGERYFIAWRGGPRHILMRASRLGSVLPHVLYAELRHGRLRLVHFVPDNPVERKFPPPLFPGHPKRDDWRNTEILP